MSVLILPHIRLIRLIQYRRLLSATRWDQTPASDRGSHRFSDVLTLEVRQVVDTFEAQAVAVD